MNSRNKSGLNFLSIAAVLATGVLTGCQYCEPLLMATLVIGAIYKDLSYSPWAGSRLATSNRIASK